MACVYSFSFNQIIQVIKNWTKFNSFKGFDKHKMVSGKEAWMAIFLCQMISMPVICLGLKIDILEMEKAFQTNYWEEDKVFCISPFNWKG
jgi:hypothetical protein